MATSGPPPAPDPPAPPPPAPPPPAAPADTRPRRIGGLPALNLLLGAVLAGVVLGPPLATRLAPTPTAGPGPGATPGGPAPPAVASPTPEAVPAPDPAPVSAEVGPETSLAREALALYRAGRIAEACERFAEAARDASAAARRQLGLCLGRLGREAYQGGRAAAAAEHYGRAVESYPEGPELWTGLAIARLATGDLDRAQAVLADAARRFPEDAEVAHALAEAQERQGRTRDAVETLRRLLARHPGHARAAALLARLDREQRVEAGYWTQESPHFVVRYEDARGLDVGRSVADVLEQAHAAIGRELDVFPPERIQVGIYRTEVLGDVIGVPAHYVRGAFDGRKLRLNLAESVAYSNDLARLVRHEYTHALIHLKARGRAPVWVHEGLAQVMEPRPAPRFLEIGVPRELLTLTGIERLSRTPQPMAFTAGYQLTHVAMQHLVDRGGMAAVRAFLERLGQGEPVAAALRQAFGFGPEEVEARLRTVGGKG